MTRVRMYVKQGCPYSAGARRLLDEKGIPYEQIDVTAHPEKRQEMARETGGRTTLPQIFFGHRHVGGYDDLQELDRTEGVRSALQESEQPPA
ncbi:MAG: glutaredoxin 3 [Anaeromyxobacteraceae bacterium]